MSISYPNMFQDGRVTYDLTGTDDIFKKEMVLTYYMDGEQIIEFPCPVYIQASKAQDTGETPPEIGSPETLSVMFMDPEMSAEDPTYTGTQVYYVANPVSGNYWSLTEGDGEDQTAMAKAYELAGEHDSLANDFNGKLAKKIRICLEKKRVTVKLVVRRFYIELTESPKYKGGDGPTYTPAFGKYILDTLDDLKVRSDIMVRNMFGNTHSASDILSEDLTGESADNRVDYELHTGVNTTAGKTLLSPAKGSFYPGVKGTTSEFKMCLYKTEDIEINETHIATHSLAGQLFIFTVNNLRVFSVVPEQYFLEGKTYYSTGSDSQGHGSGYVKLVPGTTEEVAQHKADYVINGEIHDWSQGHNNRQVYELKTLPLDPAKGFDGAINDSSMYISKEVKVLLTTANDSKYLGYRGKIVYVTPIAGDTASHPVELIYGEDYEFTNCNLAKTAKTTSAQAVYDYVRILAPMVDDDSSRVLGISYQAFGGNVSAEDVRNMRMDLSNLLKVITRNGLLTADNLSRHEVIKDLCTRIRSIETYNNYFSRVDHTVSKSYGGMHWLSIAKLWDVSFMAEMGAVKDLGTFRVSSKEMGWAYEFLVSVDLNKEGDDAFRVTVLGAHSNASSDITDTTSVFNAEQLALRLCWDTGERGLKAGSTLQLGIDFSKYPRNYIPETEGEPAASNDFDVISVVNKSGPTSMWTLCYDPLEVSQASEGLYRVYGHMQLANTEDTRAREGKTYYKRFEQYLYFVTADLVVKAEKSYYRKESGIYTQISVSTGTVISTLGYTVYERKVSGYERKILTVTQDSPINPNTTYEVSSGLNNDDSGFTLPDGYTHWYDSTDSTGPTSTSSVSVVRYIGPDNSGVIAWTGAADLALASFAPAKPPVKLILTSCLDSNSQQFINLSGVTAIGVGIVDTRTGAPIFRKIDAWVMDVEGSKQARSETMYFIEDLCGISVTARKSESVLYFDVDAGMGTNSYLNDRFVLRQIRLYF